MAKIFIWAFFALLVTLFAVGLYQCFRDREIDFSDYENWLWALEADGENGIF